MDELRNKILLKRFKIIKRIGKGAFGSVFLGKNINKDEHVAIKLELKNQADTILEREAYILHMLRGFGIPQVISYGHNVKYNILIQELLGKSLDKLLFKKNQILSLTLKDSCMIGIQILDRLEYIHNKSVIHRDIKADNFLIGLKENEIIYIIDFGLAKQFRSTKTGKHIKYSINKKWSGTSRFASANTLRGIEPSRRDDMESFCYLLLYLMKGSLPWDKIKETSEINEILMIYKMKQYMPADVMFKELPFQMSEFYNYCKNLNFEQKPNYSYLRRLLINILEYIGEKNDLCFSWKMKIFLNKSKSGVIKKSQQLNKTNNTFNENKNLFEKSESTSNKKKRKLESRNINTKNYKFLKNVNSSENINKANENKIEIKRHILGYCNIIKKKYLKSQSPIIKKVLTRNERAKKKLELKKNLIIDLTNYIENKKANEIKSYKTKLFNYKEKEKNKLILIEKKNKDKITEPLTERKIEKRNKNISYRNLVIKPILKVSTYSINDFSSKIKNNDSNKNISNGFHIEKKSLSPILSNKNNKSNLFEITKNENNLIREKIFHSNSFIKRLNLSNISNRNKNNNRLSFIFPKKTKTSFNFNNYKVRNLLENGSAIYNKKILTTNSGFTKKIGQNQEIIKHKMTDNGLSYNRSSKDIFKRIIFRNDKMKKKPYLFINQNINNSINGLFFNSSYNNPLKIVNSFCCFK